MKDSIGAPFYIGMLMCLKLRVKTKLSAEIRSQKCSIANPETF